jgi:hypothetical protein
MKAYTLKKTTLVHALSPPPCIKCQIGFNNEFQKLELRIVKYSKSGPLQKLESRIVELERSSPC